MNFVVNALPLRVGGGLTVGLNVVSELSRMVSGDRFYVLAPKGVGYEGLGAQNVVVDVFDWAEARVLGQLRYLNSLIPRVAARVGAAAIFSMGNMATLRTTLPQLLLFHKAHFVYPELWPMLFPSVCSRLKFHLERAYLRLGFSRCHVVVQTEVVRKRLIAQYRLDESRVFVVPNAVDQSQEPGAPGPQALSIATLPSPYRCIYLTRYYEHKNLKILPKVAERLRARGFHDIVFVTTLAEQDYQKVIGQMRMGTGAGVHARSILNIGAVPIDQVGHCFRQSWALVMPTLLESFSGTYIEAMRYGCPILTSDRDFARAVCGDAAVYFDPTDPEAIADAILRLRFEQGLRERLIDNGRRQLQLLSPGWTEVTKRYLELLHRLAATRSRTPCPWSR